MRRRRVVVAFLLLWIVIGGVAFADTRVACVGDSITAGWKLKEAEKYVTKLGGLLGAGYDVQNFGHSSYCMLKVADKSYWESPMFQAAKDFQPDIVTIMLGTNDAHPEYWPLYEAQYYQDYLDMIAAFQALDSQPTVIVLGLPYLKPGGRYDGVVALDAWLPDIADEAGVEFVEIWDVLVSSGLSSNQLMKDPIHPSAAAHTIIAETIFPVVAASGTSCGDGTCDPLEDSCSCRTDCGLPPVAEAICNDGFDEDCDQFIDCADPDCDLAPECQDPCDADGICEFGEDCNNCPNDCAGLSTGKPTGRYCCGDGILQGPENNGICSGNY